MHDDGLISLMNPWDKSNLDQYTRDEHLFTNVDSIRIRISATGFGLLNDIRMKKIMQETTTSINELNKGIKDFKESHLLLNQYQKLPSHSVSLKVMLIAPLPNKHQT